MKHLILQTPDNIQKGTLASGYRGTVELSPGDEVQLVLASKQRIAYAEIVDVWTGPLGDVPAVLLEMSQDPLQRTFTGFHTSLVMTRTEEGETTEMSTPVSVVLYRPKTSTLIRPTAGQARKLGLS